MKSQNGFLLSFLKYGDHDAVLHCFTAEEGFQSYFLKGIYTAKNKKKAFLLPLNKLNFSLRPVRSGSMQTVSRLELLTVHDFYTDIKANSVVFFISDFLNQMLRHENKNHKIFESIDRFTHELNHKNYRSHLIFLIIILKLQGFAPLLGTGEFLDPETGTFSQTPTHHFFDEATSVIWKTVLSADNPYEVKIPTAARKNFLDSILMYYHYHISDFKTPPSLEIIQQIFG